MPTFLDESGDTGHAANSKPYFRLAAVWLPSLEACEAFRASIRGLRQALGRKAGYEFKFAKTHSYPSGRHQFLDAALATPFRFAVCAIDKTAAYWQRASGHEQQWAAATVLAVWLRPTYHVMEQSSSPLREPIFVDDNEDRGFLGIVNRAFHGMRSSRHPGVPLTEPARFRKSHRDDVMQLADMVCGATGAMIDGDARWFDRIRGRGLGVIHLP